MTTPPGRAGLRALVVPSFSVLAFAYAIHSVEKGKGIGRRLLDFQFRWLGSATHNVTGLIAFLPLAVPAWVLAAILPSRPAPAHDTPVRSGASRPRRIWPVLLLLGALAAAPPGGIYLMLARRDEADQQRQIYPLDLGSSAPPAAEAHFLRVTGFNPVDLRFTYESSVFGGLKNSWTITPLVGPRWTPDKSVTYFFNASGGVRSSTLHGRLEREGLPVFADNQFKREGMRVAPTHYVVDHVEIVDGRVASTIRQYTLLPWMGLASGPIVFVLVGLIMLGLRRASEEPT